MSQTNFSSFAWIALCGFSIRVSSVIFQRPTAFTCIFALLLILLLQDIVTSRPLKLRSTRSSTGALSLLVYAYLHLAAFTGPSPVHITQSLMGRRQIHWLNLTTSKMVQAKLVINMSLFFAIIFSCLVFSFFQHKRRQRSSQNWCSVKSAWCSCWTNTWEPYTFFKWSRSLGNKVFAQILSFYSTSQPLD